MRLEKLTLSRILRCIFFPISRVEAFVSVMVLWGVAALGAVASDHIVAIRLPYEIRAGCMGCSLFFYSTIWIGALLGGLIIPFILTRRAPPHGLVIGVWTLTISWLAFLIYAAFEV